MFNFRKKKLEISSPKVKIKVADLGLMPQQMTSGAAGYDIRVAEIKRLRNGDVLVFTGVSLELPEDLVAKVYARSSLAKTSWILGNSVGIIDSDYRGEITMRFKKVQSSRFPYKKGDRCGQILFEHYNDVTFDRVTELSETSRGTGGYGHTGNK